MATPEIKRAEVVQHIQMIQNNISRMNANSFLLKRWSLVMLGAMMVYVRTSTVPADKFVLFLFVVGIFSIWLLDSMFLCFERGFRLLHDTIREKDETDFSMSPKTKDGMLMAVFFSKTLVMFYGFQGLLILGYAFRQ